MLSENFNSSKASNLFLVGTPYQLITALNIILNNYSSGEYENCVFIQISNAKRFDPNVLEKHGNIYFKKVSEEFWINQIRELSKWNPNKFYFFQEANILNKFLAYRFKKNSTKICLGPDGTKAYGLFNKKHEFFSKLKDTYNDYRFLIREKIFIPRLFWSKYYKYGSFKLLDEIWLPYPDIFDSVHNESVGDIKELPKLTTESLVGIANILKIKLNSEFDGNDAIIYFNQPFWSESLIDKDVEIVTELVKKVKGKNFYIKLHPSTNSEILERYLNIQGINIIEDDVPAEFYIALSKNSVFVTGWSTCLMHPISESSKYYYLYPIFKKVGDSILNQINLIKFPHICYCTEINELFD